jgi:hypothetical protein
LSIAVENLALVARHDSTDGRETRKSWRMASSSRDRIQQRRELIRGDFDAENVKTTTQT